MTEENFEKRERIAKMLDDFTVFYDTVIENEESNEVYNTYMKLFKATCEKHNIEYSTDKNKLVLYLLRELQENSNFDFSLLLDSESLKKEVFSKADEMSLEDLSTLESELDIALNQIRRKIASMMLDRGLVTEAFKALDENGEIFGIEKEPPLNAEIEEISDEEWENFFDEEEPIIWEDSSDYDWDFSDEEFEKSPKSPEPEITDEDIKDFMEFLIIIPEITKMYSNIKNVSNTFNEYKRKRQIQEYMKDTEFISNLEELMAHDPNLEEYRYHGTQSLQDGQSIMETGLLMASSDLDRTTYSEFNMEQLLLYTRGFDGSIGRDCVVIISVPKEENIVVPINSEEYTFEKSGLGGLNGGPEYMIDPSHIVGYVDKRNNIVVHNPNYIGQKGHTK